MFFGVPTVVACQLVGAVGHQRYLCGANIQHQFDKLFGGVALYVQFGFHERAERIHIAASNMPLIGAGMHRNALSAKSFAVGGKTLHIGQIAAACVAQGSHFVYIYAEPCHFLFPLSKCRNTAVSMVCRLSSLPMFLFACNPLQRYSFFPNYTNNLCYRPIRFVYSCFFAAFFRSTGRPLSARIVRIWVCVRCIHIARAAAASGALLG